MSQSVFRKWWFWTLVVVLVLVLALTLASGGGEGRVETSLTQFINDVRAGQVTKVEVDDTQVTYELTGDDTTYETEIEGGDTVRQILQDAGIDAEDFPKIENRRFSAWGSIIGIILQFLPVVFILGTLFYSSFATPGTSSPGACLPAASRRRTRSVAGEFLLASLQVVPRSRTSPTASVHRSTSRSSTATQSSTC